MQIRPFALERYFAEHEFSAEFLLCSSDVEPYALRELLALADGETRALWEGLTLGYTETAGHPLLRAEIAGLYPGLEADDVLVFAGAQEAIFAFAQTALGPDDHAVVVTPAYQSLHEVARAAGTEVSTVELEHDSGWALDLDDVRRAALLPGAAELSARDGLRHHAEPRAAGAHRHHQGLHDDLQQR